MTLQDQPSDNNIASIEGDSTMRLTHPFGHQKLSVQMKSLSVATVVTRMKKNGFDFKTPFQRRDAIWSRAKMSSLIVSLLLDVPLPFFLFAESEGTTRYDVLDGLQRLSTLRAFIAPELTPDEKPLRLTKLEKLPELEGLTFSELPEDLQETLMEAQIYSLILKNGNHPEAARHVFMALNTGGIPLNRAELDNALYLGPATTMMADLANSELFRTVTGNSINPARMADRAVVSRCLAFLVTPYTEYAGKLESFVGSTLGQINKLSGKKRDALTARFNRAMQAALDVFPPDAVARKPSEGRKTAFNKALFEAIIAALDRLDDDQLKKLSERKNAVYAAFLARCQSDVFLQAISTGTGDGLKVDARFRGMEDIFAEALNAPVDAVTPPTADAEDKLAPIANAKKSKPAAKVTEGPSVQRRKGKANSKK